MGEGEGDWRRKAKKKKKTKKKKMGNGSTLHRTPKTTSPSLIPPLPPSLPKVGEGTPVVQKPKSERKRSKNKKNKRI
jgi:hypothetical protein